MNGSKQIVHLLLEIKRRITNDANNEDYLQTNQTILVIIVI